MDEQLGGRTGTVTVLNHQVAHIKGNLIYDLVLR